MGRKTFVVKLSDDEKQTLLDLTNKGVSSARKIRRAYTLLHANDDAHDEDVARLLHASVATVERTRRRFVEGGLGLALNDLPKVGRARKLDGKQEAFVVALACTDPPVGREKWTMQMLADKVVELKVVDSICDDTIRRTIKRGASNPG